MKEKIKPHKPGKDLKGNPTGGQGRNTKIRFKSLLDIRRYLARTLNNLEVDTIAEGKARVIGYLCSVMRDIIKDSDLEIRVEKLEKAQEVQPNEKKY